MRAASEKADFNIRVRNGEAVFHFRAPSGINSKGRVGIVEGRSKKGQDQMFDRRQGHGL